MQDVETPDDTCDFGQPSELAATGEMISPREGASIPAEQADGVATETVIAAAVGR